VTENLGPFARIADALEADALTLASAKASELEARLSTARGDVLKHRAKAHELAFAAEGADDGEAKRLATKLLTDAGKLEEDIKHRLEPAVAEAQRRLDSARKAEAEAAKRRAAIAAGDLAAHLGAIGAEMDAALARLVAAKREALAIIGKLNGIGAGSPAAASAAVLISHLADDVLRRSGLVSERPMLLLSPQRTNFSRLLEGWGAMTMNWSAKALGGEKEKAA
jgi:hypothetical protein